MRCIHLYGHRQQDDNKVRHRVHRLQHNQWQGQYARGHQGPAKAARQRGLECVGQAITLDQQQQRQRGGAGVSMHISPCGPVGGHTLCRCNQCTGQARAQYAGQQHTQQQQLQPMGGVLFKVCGYAKFAYQCSNQRAGKQVDAHQCQGQWRRTTNEYLQPQCHQASGHQQAKPVLGPRKAQACE